MRRSTEAITQAAIEAARAEARALQEGTGNGEATFLRRRLEEEAKARDKREKHRTRMLYGLIALLVMGLLALSGVTVTGNLPGFGDVTLDAPSEP